MKEMEIDEFVRRFKEWIEKRDSKFVFFLGAGCSVSSGIPDAKTLVLSWLPRLKKLKTGNDDNYNSWLKELYPDFNEENASSFYGRVIEDLFVTGEERQSEIERLTEGQDPGFGYAVLAQLMTSNHFGNHCNVVLTVNFDDLIADALYLYTNKKPLVISHDSLAGFVRITRTRPLIIKLHGDARLEPKNTEQETKELADSVKKVLKNLLYETGLVFIGYGGHDESISEILNELPPNALPWGIYWIGSKIPESKLGKWVKQHKAILVKQKDFDETMLIIMKEFNLSHPQKDRFDKLIDTYFDTIKRLEERIEKEPTDKVQPFKNALDKVKKEIKSWWAVEIEASKYRIKDPEKADKIYQEGLKEFPNNTNLMGNYANFSYKICKNYERAEEYFKKVIDVDPYHYINLSNYALFLYDIRRDYDKSEEYYKKAVELNPNNAITLGNYALFLYDIRKDYNKAEEYYRKAIELSPNYIVNLNNYAIFLYYIHKDYEKAEEYYKKSLNIEPNNLITLSNYAGFLLSKGKKEGFSTLERALNLSRKDMFDKVPFLECLFYQYAHRLEKDIQLHCLKEIKVLLDEGVRSPRWNLSDNVKRAIEDGHPYPDFLERLAKVISEEIDIKELDSFEIWREIT